MTQTSWSPRDLDILRQDIDQLFDRVRKTQKGEEDLAPLRQKINQLLDHVWERQKEKAWGEGTWNPMVDVADEGKKIAVAVELPGIKPKNVTVNTDGDMLAIQGEKKPDKKSKNIGLLQAERTFGSFSRSLRLPARVKSDTVKAEFKNGVLLLEMKKAKKTGRQGIELEEEKELANGKAKSKKDKRKKGGPGKGKLSHDLKADAQTTQPSPVSETESQEETSVDDQKTAPKKAIPSRRRKSKPKKTNPRQSRKGG